LYKDFWGELPVFNKHYFKHFSKLPIELFDDIVEALLVLHDDCFCQSLSRRFGSLHRGVLPIEHNDNYGMATSIGMETMKQLCNGIIVVYSQILRLLWHLIVNDVNRIPGCIRLG
jgi:hypothetical protein